MRQGWGSGGGERKEQEESGGGGGEVDSNCSRLEDSRAFWHRQNVHGGTGERTA